MENNFSFLSFCNLFNRLRSSCEIFAWPLCFATMDEIVVKVSPIICKALNSIWGDKLWSTSFWHHLFSYTAWKTMCSHSKVALFCNVPQKKSIFTCTSLSLLVSDSQAKEKTTGIELDGRRIRVDFSITRRPHTPTPGIYMGKPTRYVTQSLLLLSSHIGKCHPCFCKSSLSLWEQYNLWADFWLCLPQRVVDNTPEGNLG